jgi:hypothetical protein
MVRKGIQSMQQLPYTSARSDRVFAYSVVEKVDLYTVLVSLGAGALGATILATLSGALAYLHGT